MDYRLIALDADDTTIVAGQPPSQRVLDALAAAQQQGVRVILATGRPYRSALQHAQALGLAGPLICFQGALVKEQNDGQHTLLADSLSPASLEGVLEFAEKRRLEFSLYTENEIYVAGPQHDDAFYDLWFGMPVRKVPNLAQTVHSLEEQGVRLIKGVFVGEQAELDALELELKALVADRLNVIRSHRWFLEIVAPTTSKGNALAFLARHYGIPQRATIAVGDSGNDISMIKWAGLGVAMGNGSPQVQAVADWIAPSVRADGVAHVIERFILEEDLQASRRISEDLKDGRDGHASLRS